MVEHITQNLRVAGSIPATGAGDREWQKIETLLGKLSGFTHNINDVAYYLQLCYSFSNVS
jgi:hypothetical protein